MPNLLTDMNEYWVQCDMEVICLLLFLSLCRYNPYRWLFVLLSRENDINFYGLGAGIWVKCH